MKTQTHKGSKEKVLNKDCAELDEPQRKTWAVQRFKYFCVRTAFSFLGFVFTVIPERLAYAFGENLCHFFYYAAPKYRALMMKHLNIAFGAEKSPEEIRKIAVQTYRNFGKNLTEFLMFPNKSDAWIEKKVTFNDPEWHIKQAYAKGKGIVALGAHFGSWELVGARIGLYKYPIVAVAKAQRDAVFTKYIMETRTKHGNEIIFRQRGIKEECYRQLNMNKILGLVADQNASKSGLFVDFFGKPAATFRGPAEIAIKQGCPIVPAFPTRNPDNTITLHVFPPIEISNTGDLEEDILVTTRRCQKVIEDFISAHPADYFWWHRRWRTRPTGEKSDE